MTQSKAAAFRALHESGCFVLPNPWDAGSATYLEHLGFPALATTSGGLAFSKATPDEHVTFEVALANIQEIVGATRLPVSADLQNGYSDDPAQLAEHVRRAVFTGIAGLSIEDATGRPEAPLYGRAHAVARIEAARSAIAEANADVVLTGRCEAFLVRDPDGLQTALDRLVDYAAAGADCLFAPGVREKAHIAAIVKAVHPKPVNVLVGAPGGLSLDQLRDLGVRRISVGSALARAAWVAFARAAQALAQGRFDGFEGATGYLELNAFFMGSSGRDRRA